MFAPESFQQSAILLCLQGIEAELQRPLTRAQRRYRDFQPNDTVGPGAAPAGAGR